MAKKKQDKKKSELQDSWAALASLPREKKSIFHYQNVECLKCAAIERDMIRVGCLYFCPTCAFDEFKTEDPVYDEREKYLEWLNKWKEEQERVS